MKKLTFYLFFLGFFAITTKARVSAGSKSKNLSRKNGGGKGDGKKGNIKNGVEGENNADSENYCGAKGTIAFQVGKVNFANPPSPSDD